MAKNRKKSKIHKPEHTQVPFTTCDGEDVTVDEGMVDILTLLNSAGVRTQFSCQGGEFSAYILADSASFEPVLHKVRHRARKGFSSPSASLAELAFRRGSHHFDLAHYSDESILPLPDMEQKFRWGKRLGGRQAYSIERSYSLHYGARTALRWNKMHTDNVYLMFWEALA